MKIVKAICAVAAAGMIASAASAQTVKQQTTMSNQQTTTTKTVTKAHVEKSAPANTHHVRHVARGHRTCHMVWRHHHHVRVCRVAKMHVVRHTTVTTKVVTH